MKYLVSAHSRKLYQFVIPPFRGKVSPNIINQRATLSPIWKYIFIKLAEKTCFTHRTSKVKRSVWKLGVLNSRFFFCPLERNKFRQLAKKRVSRCLYPDINNAVLWENRTCGTRWFEKLASDIVNQQKDEIFLLSRRTSKVVTEHTVN